MSTPRHTCGRFMSVCPICKKRYCKTCESESSLDTRHRMELCGEATTESPGIFEGKMPANFAGGGKIHLDADDISALLDPGYVVYRMDAKVSESDSPKLNPEAIAALEPITEPKRSRFNLKSRLRRGK